MIRICTGELPLGENGIADDFSGMERASASSTSQTSEWLWQFISKE